MTKTKTTFNPNVSKFSPIIWMLFFVAILPNLTSAQVSLPALFCDNMVLQQDFSAPIWGWAEPGTEVIVSGSWSKAPAKSVIADDEGNWKVTLSTASAGGPYQISINDVTIKNVMLGEVWICSGQSNMQWALESSENAEEEIPNADFPGIRLFYVARDNADEPSRNCYGKWELCEPISARSFSAVAYYFGKELHSQLNVPIGLIHVSWGGSSAQAWINRDVLKSTTEGNFYIGVR